MSFLIDFFICLCHIVLSVSCSGVVTCWESDDLLALLCVTFCCVFVTFPYSVLVQVLDLIVSIPGFCILPYFYNLEPNLMKLSKDNGVCSNFLT